MKKVEGLNGTEFDYTNPAALSFEGEKQHQVIRLSEVYCWYAEAVGRAKLGGADKSEAVRVLNEVRNRADGKNSNIYSISMSDEELAEAAYNERAPDMGNTFYYHPTHLSQVWIRKQIYQERPLLEDYFYDIQSDLSSGSYETYRVHELRYLPNNSHLLPNRVRCKPLQLTLHHSSKYYKYYYSYHLVYLFANPYL